MTQIRITLGSYRNEDVINETFALVKPFKEGINGSFVTVVGTERWGIVGKPLRIKTEIGNFELFGGNVTESVPAEPTESDDEVIARIRDRFGILDEMTHATCSGVVRGMIVTGPPGVGKSFGVEKILDEAAVEAKLKYANSEHEPQFGIEKGACSPIGLYQMLHYYSGKGSVMVLDDSDSILYEEESLNMLKAVLDSGKKRKISWRKESKVLENAGIPTSFEFKGSIIFITNLKFDNARGKIGDHLEAIMSRCHYLDLTMDTMREKYLRCHQIVSDGMLDVYDFTADDVDEVMTYLHDNQPRLREISLRMVTKIADLKKMSPTRWMALAESTCLRRT